MEVDDVHSSPRVHGKGKSLKVIKTLKKSMQPLERVKIMVDGIEVDSEDNDDFVTDDIDVLTCHEKALANGIARCINHPATVPQEILCHSCSVIPKSLEEIVRDFIILPPFQIRAAT